ncbi:MAG: Ig-like domain-containing protein [Bacteroidia bacterium]
MKFLKPVLFIAILGTSFMQAQNFNWARQPNTTGFTDGEAVGIDSLGNVYVAGMFGGTVDFDPGPGVFNLSAPTTDDGYLLKLDANGAFQWVKQMKSINAAEPTCIKINSNGVYVFGLLTDSTNFDPGVSNFTMWPLNQSGYFVAQFTPSGTFMWAKQLAAWGYATTIYGDMALDAAGNIIVSGGFDLTGDFDPGPGTFTMAPVTANQYDAFAAKLSPSGNFIWAKRMGGPQVDFSKGAGVDAAGNVYMTGYFQGTADFDPGPGSFMLTSLGSQDQFIAKLDPSGNFAWAGQCGSSLGTGNGISIAVRPNGESYTCGNFNGIVDFNPGPGTYTLLSAGGTDIAVMKLDAAGNFLWAGSFGSTGAEESYRLAVDSSGDVYTTGYFENINDFDPGPGTYTLSSYGASPNVFIQKLDASGNFVWAGEVTGSAMAEGMDIAVDRYKNIYTTGYFNGLCDFDPGPAISYMFPTGGAFVLKLSPSCSPPAPPVNTTSPSSLVSICDGHSIGLTVSGTGYINWYASTTSTTSIASGTIYSTPTLTVGSYTYYAEAMTCTASISRTAITVTVNPLPAVSLAFSSTMTCNGSPVSLIGTPAGGVYTGSLVTGSVFNAPMNTISLGTYSVVYSYTDSATGCSNVATNTLVVSACMGLAELNEASGGVRIYPNPATADFNVQLGKEIGQGRLNVINSLGQEVWSQQVSEGINVINCGSLAKGIYLYTVCNATHVVYRGRLVMD